MPLSCANIRKVQRPCSRAVLLIVEIVQEGVCDARHTKLFDSEQLASSYASNYCRQHTQYNVRTLEEAYDDPRWRHLRQWQGKSSLIEVVSEL